MAQDATPDAPPYATLITEQLAEERARKTSIERRGLAVITTSGTLVTALFSIAALVTRREDFHLTRGTAWLVTAASALLLLAAAAAIATNAPLRYSEVGERDLESWTTKDAWDHAPDAGRVTAVHRVRILIRARRVNGIKVRVLILAMCCEVLAVLCVASAVAVVLLSS